MAVDLNGIFRRIRMRSLHKKNQNLVEKLGFGLVLIDMTIVYRTGRYIFHRFFWIFEGENLFKNIKGLRPRDPHDPDA